MEISCIIGAFAGAGVFLQTMYLAASESELDHTNRILCLKVGLLVHTMSRFSKWQGQLFIAFLFYGCFTDNVVVAKLTVKQTAQLFCH